VGTFYHYYKTKEDVFYELYRNADEYFEDSVYPLLYSGDLDTAGKILLFFKKYSEYNTENGLDYVGQLYNTKNKFFILRDRYMLDLLYRIITEGQEAGEIKKEIDAEEIMEDLFIVSRGIVFDWCLHDGAYDLAEKMNSHLERHIAVFST
jgi:AcrR family transcriptional regulator